MDFFLAFLDKMDGDASWGVQVFFIIFFSLVGSYLVNVICKRLHTKVEKTKNIWDDALVHAARRPLSMMVLILGFTFAIEVVYKAAKTEIFSAVYPIRDVLVIANIAWFCLRLIRIISASYVKHQRAKNQEVDITTVDAISKLLRIAVIITAALILMQSLGYSISGVLAFGGVGGVAVGFAAKDLLANFFGAVMVYLDKPFAVGDWIRSQDREIEGTVESIGWRQTRIRTFDKRPLYVPNSVFSTVAVENPSRMTHRRIYETIGVRYNDVGVVADIIDAVKTMLKEHKEIDESQTLIVNVNQFAASSIDFFVYTFTHTTNWVAFHEIKQDVLLKIAAIIEDKGAEIAYPTQTLHVSAVSVEPESA